MTSRPVSVLIPGPLSFLSPQWDLPPLQGQSHVSWGAHASLPTSSGPRTDDLVCLLCIQPLASPRSMLLKQHWLMVPVTPVSANLMDFSLCLTAPWTSQWSEAPDCPLPEMLPALFLPWFSLYLSPLSSPVSCVDSLFPPKPVAVDIPQAGSWGFYLSVQSHLHPEP